MISKCQIHCSPSKYDDHNILYGIRESSVPFIMKGAGLTHGGFYSHFENKEELIAATCTSIIDHTLDELRVIASNEQPESQIDRIVDYYLSPKHRDHVEKGCIIPILSGEIAQSSDEIQNMFSQELNRYMEFISEISGCDQTTSGAVLSILVGSLLLARGIKDDMLSTEILNQGKLQAKHLLKFPRP